MTRMASFASESSDRQQPICFDQTPNRTSAAHFYDAEGWDREIAIEDISPNNLTDQQLIWFDLEAEDRATVSRLSKLLDLPANLLSLEPDNPLATLVLIEGKPAFDLIRASIEDGPIRFVVGPQWLVTIRKGTVSYFDEFRDRERGDTLIGQLSSLALAGSLIDWHLEEFHQNAEAIQHRLDELDVEILHARRGGSPLVELSRLRHRAARLRARLERHRPLVRAMLRPDFVPAADDSAGEFFRTLESHYERAEDALDRVRQLIAESFELYATLTAQNTNDLVRALTIVTVATGFSAALAGIFGMNFDIPLFHTGMAGFVAITGAMAAVATGILIFARHRDWL